MAGVSLDRMSLGRKVFGISLILCLTLLCVELYSVSNVTWKDIRPRIDLQFRGKRNVVHWIVTTTVTSSPQAYINQLSTLFPRWNIVIVASEKTPHNLTCENCFILYPNDQNNAPFKISNSGPGKNIGYLYAISRGAEFIYDTEESYLPLRTPTNFQMAPKTTGMIYNGQQQVFDVFRHFGQSSIKQRGFPLGKKRQPRDNIFKLSDKFKTPLIQHALINGDPDVDEIVKMALGSKTNTTFDDRTPPVVISERVFAPFNSKNTLFLRDAFWALLLPVTSFDSNRDIVRSYWGQRLLWEIGGTVGFFPPNMFHQRIVNNQERSVYFKSSRLVNFLQNWKCPGSVQFEECVNKLGKDLREEKFWDEEDYKLVKNWLIDLKMIGFKFPKRSKFNTEKKDDRNVVFSPSVITAENDYSSKWKQVIAITNHCKDKSYQITSSSMKAEPLSDVLLVVMFNHPYYDNIPYIHLMYSVTFDNIVYCGYDFNKFQKSSKSFPQPVTFIEQDVNKGFCTNKCISVALKLNYKVKGYLIIGDDTLLNSWNIRHYPKDKLWFSAFEPVFQNKTHPWYWWQTQYGQKTYNEAWGVILNASKGTSKESKMVKNYVDMLKKNTGSDLGLYHGPSDIVYIPHAYKDIYIYINDIFLQFDVFLEISIPTLIAGLTPLKEMVELKGQYLWYDGKRDKIPELFKKNEIFIHPVKLSQIQTKLRTFFCQTFFPLLVSGKTNSTMKVPFIKGVMNWFIIVAQTNVTK